MVYTIRTKFGREMPLALKWFTSREAGTRESYYASEDGKMWQIDENKNLYLIGSFCNWTKADGWHKTDRRCFWDKQGKVPTGKVL